MKYLKSIDKIDFIDFDDEYYLNNYVIDEYNGRYKRGEVNYEE